MSRREPAHPRSGTRDEQAAHPKVLVLDETTASPDAASEQDLVDAVAGLAGGTTVIAVSHREFTLTVCDRRLVLGD